MMLNLAKGEDFCMCVCMSRDLLNRPWFQFHASEFDRERERERVPSQLCSLRADERRDGRREVKGEKEAGRTGHKVQEETIYLPLQTHQCFIA